MRRGTRAAMTVIAAALLLGPFATLAAGQQPQYPPRNEGGPNEGAPMRAAEPMIAITGMLQSDGADGYMLVDKASGDSITLKKKAKKLGELEGKNVTLTGRWYKNDETTKTFKVVKVAETPAESPASATHAEQPAAPTALSIPEDTTAPQQPAAPQEQPTPQEQLEPDTAPVPEAPEQAPSTP